MEKTITSAITDNSFAELISTIINELVDTNTTLSAPLLKTKVIASKLKHSELLDWVNSELGGYSKNDSIPPYRKTDAQVFGMALNGNMQYKNVSIPTSGLPDEMSKKLRNVEFDMSISVLESMVAKQNKTGELEIKLSAEVIGIIEDSIQRMGNPYYHLVSARKVITINAFVQVIASVRSKLLDFILKLDEEMGSSGTIEKMILKKDKISTIMKQTIINTTGDGNVVNTGAAAELNIKIEVKKGDQNALHRLLAKNGVGKDEVAELFDFIDNESPKDGSGSFGPRVNGWIQKMIGKALNGTWQVGVGAAGALLADGLKAYYGFK
jgi:hypothetical protein